MGDILKTPRIYFERNFSANANIVLDTAQTHYLKNVLRMKPGEFIRLFNGRDGEWLASIANFNKTDANVTVKGKVREQPKKPAPLHLLFAPIKKDRMDFMIEKAVELGVTDIHPVLSARTEVRKINEERLKAQLTEAAEQCERMDVPVLHALSDLRQKIPVWGGAPLFWCRERSDSPHISTLTNESWAFLIGPEGGFDDAENEFLSKQTGAQPVSLGENILRAETAAIFALSYAKIKRLV